MRKILFLFYLISILSCDYDKTSKIVEIQFSDAKIINMERKIVNTELYRPSKIFIYKDKLVIYDDMNNSLFKIFECNDLTYKYSFGSIGQGPNEFAFVVPETMNSSTYFEILDRNKLCYFSITDTGAFQIASPKIVSHQSGPVNNLKKMSDSIYIFENGLGTDKFDKEFILYNINDRTNREFGNIRFFDNSVKAQNKEEQYFSLSKFMTANPVNNKFAVFYDKYPYFKIFSSEILSGLYHIDSKIQHTDFRHHFSRPFSTDKYIYVMWIEKSDEEIMANISDFNPLILIFDWNGNLIKNYRLNKPIIAFAVNDSNDKLYAVSLSEDDINAIYTCDLNISDNEY
jgi:hypothetical protein